MVNVKRRPEIMQDYSKTMPLTQEDFYALRLLNEAIHSKLKLSDEEKKFLSNFLTGTIQNPAKHHKLHQSLSAMDLEKLQEAAICTLDIGFRTRHLNELDDGFFMRMSEVKTKLARGETLGDEERISIRQYAIMHDLATLAPTLERLTSLGLQGTMELKTKSLASLETEKTIGLKIKIQTHFQPTLFHSENNAAEFLDQLSKLLLTRHRVEMGPTL